MIKYTTEFLINELVEYYEKNGIPPKGKYFHIAMNTYCRRFGSWNNALLAANIPLNNTKHAFKCKECSEIFHKTKHTNRKFCSRSCSVTYHNKLRKTDKCLCCDKFISKGQKYCSHEHQHKYQYNHNIKPRIEIGDIDDRKVLKKYLTRERGYKCETCGINNWRGKELSLELDHIDGNADNNLPINLRLLCPNCHSITPSWKGRNKGNGRKTRGLPLN